MLRSIITLTARHFFRNLYFSGITLGSLIVGISVVTLVFLWDRYEFGYDREDPDADRVFAVLSNEELDGDINMDEAFNIPLAEGQAEAAVANLTNVFAKVYRESSSRTPSWMQILRCRCTGKYFSVRSRWL